MNIGAILRTSEFWVGVATALGQAGVGLGWWDQETFNNVLLPALVYIIGRVLGKVAKKVSPVN